MTTEKLVGMANRLYECRRACHSMFGAKYAEIVDPYGKVIRHVSAERGIDTIPAAIAMCKEMQALHKDPIITICLMAAAVDIVEPPTPQHCEPR
jgi:hypothetical protein